MPHEWHRRCRKFFPLGVLFECIEELYQPQFLKPTQRWHEVPVHLPYHLCGAESFLQVSSGITCCTESSIFQAVPCKFISLNISTTRICTKMEGPTSDILGLDPYTWTLQMDVSNRARPFFNLCRVSSNISDDGHR